MHEQELKKEVTDLLVKAEDKGKIGSFSHA